MDKPLRQPFLSKAKNKKYSVYVMKDGKRRLINFGDKRYGQFKDSTSVGAYKSMDHGDQKRRKSYLARHGKATDRNSAKWFSHKYLWSA